MTNFEYLNFKITWKCKTVRKVRKDWKVNTGQIVKKLVDVVSTYILNITSRSIFLYVRRYLIDVGKGIRNPKSRSSDYVAPVVRRFSTFCSFVHTSQSFSRLTNWFRCRSVIATTLNQTTVLTVPEKETIANATLWLSFFKNHFF